MRYQRLGSLALNAYPPSVRTVRGEEMLGTLLDAGEDSTGAFISGCASLVVGGLRERARENARIGARRLIADGFCQGAVLMGFYTLLAGIQERETPVPHGYIHGWLVWKLVVVAAVLVFALLGRDRLAGLCGVGFAGYMLIHAYGLPASDAPGALVLYRWGIALVCFAVMVLKPRIRAYGQRKLLWLIAGATVAVVSLMPQLAVAVAFVLLLGLPLLGMFLLPVDPRLAIASALLWADLFASATRGFHGHVRIGLVTIPVLLLTMLIVIARGKALAGRTPA
jgi:hypothetical protein